MLYLDAFDPSITANYKYRTIPYDLSINSAGSFNLGSFGSFPTMSVDGAGNKIRVWKFNLSRYVQHILTGTQSIYDFRLLAPFSFIEQFGIPPGADITIPISINTSVAKGRVRVGGGNHPTQRMRLRLIYSKL